MEPSTLYDIRERTGLEVEKEAEWGLAADWGTQLHAAKAGLDVGEPYGGLMVPFRGKLWPNRLGAHEVGVSYDCATRRAYTFHGTADEVDAWKKAQSESCVVGTSDWLGQLPTGEPWIDDFKTGWQVPEVVTEQTQLYLLVDMLVQVDNYRPNTLSWPTGRLSITHWSKCAYDAGDQDEPQRFWKQVSLTQLELFEDEVVAAWRRATTLPTLAIPGVQCLYCPSALVCPRAND